MTDIDQLLNLFAPDPEPLLQTVPSTSYIPSPMGFVTELKRQEAAAAHRQWMIQQFKDAHADGQGISTAALSKAMGHGKTQTARIYELRRAGWDFGRSDKCPDGTRIYWLRTTLQGPPDEKLFGWEVTAWKKSGIEKCDVHKDSEIDPDLRESLDAHMTAALREWLDTNDLSDLWQD